ncbi:MAG: YlxM family DNA-binding protein [Erysipelothrix sp.]
MSFEKAILLNQLFDYYEPLLTQKQKEVFRMYYHEDLSYQEIADIQEISRAAVYDNLNRTSNLLEDYEKKLGVAKRYQTLFNKLNELNDSRVNQILDEFIKKGE